MKIVATTGPGSSVDVCARVLADHLTRIWGQQVIVFNEPGAAGAIAIRAVAATPPDGHTLIMSLASNYIALPELQTSFPVDLVRDFVPIGFVGEHPMVIGAVASLKVSTLPELIALLKQRPGELNVAAGNRGSILHLTGEWLRNATGTQFTMLHYAAGSQSLPDLIAGRLQVMIDAMPAMRPGIEGGHLKPLAVATKQRLQNFPDLPTVAETIPGFEAMGWLALMAPPGTPGPWPQDQRRPAPGAGATGPDAALPGARHLYPPDHARGAHELRPRAAADLAAGDRRNCENYEVAPPPAVTSLRAFGASAGKPASDREGCPSKPEGRRRARVRPSRYERLLALLADRRRAAPTQQHAPAIASITALIGRVTRTIGSPFDSTSARRRNSSIIGPEDEAEQHRRRLAAELVEDVAEQAEQRHQVDVERGVAERRTRRSRRTPGSPG